MSFTFDVFISHASEDTPRIVRPLTEELARRGVTYWVDIAEFSWGDDLVRGINEGLANSEYTIVVFTTSFLAKAWPLREFSSALSMEIAKEETHVLPLFAGTDAEIDTLRARIPLIHSKIFLRWQDDAAEVAESLVQLLARSKRLYALRSLADEEYQLTTAFWAGRYSEAASSAQTALELAISRQDYDIAALSLANLILISRSRSRFADVVFLMRRYFPSIPFKKISDDYKYRLVKELFVYYYEIEDFERSALYLQRMEAIDPSLMLYTPSDDWLPGTIRWRKAHLRWIKDVSGAALANSISIAQEGVSYLQDVARENPNSAGLASASLNVGWLYFLDDNPICLDYFEQAVALSGGYSPRTRIEAEVAQEMAAAKFGMRRTAAAMGRTSTLVSRLKQAGYPNRSYAFLERDPLWLDFQHVLDPKAEEATSEGNPL